MADHIFVRRLVEEHGRFRQQAEEPAARLVEALGDEIRRETGLEDLLVLERIVVLRHRHRPGVEPDVDQIRHPAHDALALLAAQRHTVDVGPVEVSLERQAQLADRPDAATVVAFLAFPNR